MTNTPTDRGNGDERSPRPRRRGLISGTISVVLASVVLVLTVINLFPSTTVLQEFVNLFWTNAAPYVVVLGILALVLALVRARGRRSTATAVIIGLAVLSVVAPSVQIGRVMVAAAQAGGAVNPVSALAIGAGARQPDRTETYATVGGSAQNAQVWLPRNTTSPAPVLMIIHGGGWIQGNGTALSYAGWASSFADHGYLVVSLDYRLSTAEHASWNESGPDVACGLGWTAANAAALGGDPDAIAVMGASAGGNLSLNLAWSSAGGVATSSCGGTVPVPRAVVAYVPVVDPQDAYDNGVPFPGGAPKMFVSNYIGGSPSQYPDRMDAISTGTYIADDVPPTLIIEPDNDGYIPSSGVFAFARDAASQGADVTVARLPVVNHFAFDVNSIADQAIISIARTYLDGVLRG